MIYLEGNRESGRDSLFEGTVVVLEALLEVRGDDDERVDDRLEAVAEVAARGEALLDLVGVEVRAKPVSKTLLSFAFQFHV